LIAINRTIVPFLFLLLYTRFAHASSGREHPIPRRSASADTPK
jgi:hypothetical protein